MLRNCAVDFVEICNVYVRKMIIEAAKRIFNSDKICRSYSELNFGVTFLEHSVYTSLFTKMVASKEKNTYIQKYNKQERRQEGRAVILISLVISKVSGRSFVYCYTITCKYV